MRRKPVEHLEPQELLDQSSKLWIVLKICLENSSDCSCTDTATVPNIALVSKVKFGEPCDSERLQVYVIK